MKKLFILGGSQLQMDLILEAKKMFFYTIVLDMDKFCLGRNFCDEFLELDISNKNLVLKKAREYKIDAILTSATELGNITACFVGEKLGLNTNSFVTAINTTNKLKMKEICNENNIKTAKYKLITKDNIKVEFLPCVIKPTDSSGNRGISYVNKKQNTKEAINQAFKYSKEKKVLIEEYIEGVQYSCETISCKSKHQIIAFNKEYIRKPPYIMEVKHKLPVNIKFNKKIEKFIMKILNVFKIKFGATHIEFRMTKDNEVYLIELATRTGGMRSEMINFAYGISYSRLLLYSTLGILEKLELKQKRIVKCNFVVDFKSYKKYLEYKNNNKFTIFEPKLIEKVDKDFKAINLLESKGYYYVIRK